MRQIRLQSPDADRNMPAWSPRFRYLSHPQVLIDPAVAVPQWGLNDVGKARIDALARAGWLARTVGVVSSAERKAIETAEPLADSLGLGVEIREAMHENDRSATGFLPPDEFEQAADLLFAYPEISINGWKRAVDAQRRIVQEVGAVLADSPAGDLLIVGHGGVGTLLLCHLGGRAIDRRRDQGNGGGNYFAFDRESRKPIHGWVPMDQAPDQEEPAA